MPAIKARQDAVVSEQRHQGWLRAVLPAGRIVEPTAYPLRYERRLGEACNLCISQPGRLLPRLLWPQALALVAVL
jgi:hypothetical protein